MSENEAPPEVWENCQGQCGYTVWCAACKAESKAAVKHEARNILKSMDNSSMERCCGEINKIRVGISACLLGENVRYDGGHREDRYLTQTLSRYFDWAPVCPEVEYGLGVPREAMRLVGDLKDPRLVTIRTGIDHTDGMRQWASERLNALERENLCGFIFKSKSPSSGMAAVKVYPDDGGAPIEKGVGIFASALMKRFPLLPVEEDGRLHDPVLRENFLERILMYCRGRGLCLPNGSRDGSAG